MLLSVPQIQPHSVQWGGFLVLGSIVSPPRWMTPLESRSNPSASLGVIQKQPKCKKCLEY